MGHGEFNFRHVLIESCHLPITLLGEDVEHSRIYVVSVLVEILIYLWRSFQFSVCPKSGHLSIEFQCYFPPLLRKCFIWNDTLQWFIYFSAFPGSSEIKNQLAMQETQVQFRKILWRRKWQPTPVLLPAKSHGQRSLVDYNPWGHKSQTRLSN